MLRIHHVNLQPATGGGEMYTHALTRALRDAGAEVALYAHPGNRLWDDLPGVRAVPGEDELLARLPPGSLVLTQGPLAPAALGRLAREHRLVSFAHMPILEGRSAEHFRACRLVVTVSQYCIGLLRRAGIAQVHDEPLYGVADAARAAAAPVLERSPYIWDRRKFRDRLFSVFSPLADALRPETTFEKPSGLTLGIVSLISPIKQFPRLFSILAPHLARHPQVRLEIFGNGGYAQVRDLRRALAPLGERARFWGFQDHVAAIYPRLDWLMTGLPEKEALGLNALEAQACGTPVLAPDAPPFTETVLHERTGLLYRDPRADGGADFARLLDAIAAGRPRPDPRAASEHLAKFSYPALVARARRLLERLARL
jgi:glycosyltransferase involved in cell wall biosynthesis